MPLIDIARGEPDFHTPAYVKRAGCEAIEADFTKYTPQPGIPELREAIAAKFRTENGIEADAEDVVVSCGGKHSVEQAIRCLLRPGDEALIVAPHWFAYPEQVKLAGGTRVLVPARESDGFVPTLENIQAALTRHTRLLILNSPSNPTGAVYPRHLIEAIAALVLDNGLYVLSDEVYERILFDSAEHVSIASVDSDAARRCITVNSVSKTHAMTGWRIGYAHLPGGLAEKVTGIQQVSTSAPAAMCQRAALAALTGDQGHVKAMAAAYAERRAALLERVAAVPGLHAFAPKGTFYCLVNMNGLVGRRLRGHRILDADTFARVAEADAGVRVLSAAPFGAPEHLRLSFAVSLEAIHAGMDHLAQLIAEGE